VRVPIFAVVLVLLVMVAFVERSVVKEPRVPVRSEEKKLVVVAAVPVALVKVNLLNWLVAEKVFWSARRVEEAPEVLRQVPEILKHPAVRLMPFAKLEVPAPVTARKEVVAAVAVRFPRFPAVAVSTEAKKLVDVACVVVLRRMLVKTLVPEKVLLSASSVEEAAVIALLQPKLPFWYVSAWEALVHVVRPAP
jgi:uncharacterized membrane protein